MIAAVGATSSETSRDMYPMAHWLGVWQGRARRLERKGINIVGLEPAVKAFSEEHGCAYVLCLYGAETGCTGLWFTDTEKLIACIQW